jgi:hypothetical protein
MKRFHVHVAVGDLSESIRFYSAMFGAEPAVTKPDYAKWMLEDPRLNFAISTRSAASGINHLGLQAETDEELEAIHANLRKADESIIAEKGVSCCYAKSDKYWVTDPQGIAWESFRSLGTVPLYNGGAETPASPQQPAAASYGATTACCSADDSQASRSKGCCSV